MTSKKNTTDSSGFTCDTGDWRRCLLGPKILVNRDAENMVKANAEETMVDSAEDEQPQTLIPVAEACDTKRYDTIALFIGADYCPHCKAFAPTVHSSLSFLEAKRCKVIFVSNDRTEEAFRASCDKNLGIDVMPYDVSKTKAMRDLFNLETIPALILLKNDNFADNYPQVITNARHTLVADPEAKHFPWVAADGPISMRDRFLIRGKYGKWWELGHHANPDFPDQIYMDEHAVRARAGLLNIMTWIAIINVWFWKEPDYVNWLFPIMAYEFLTSMFVGLTPISPFGVIGSLFAILFHPEPLWKPARPKRLAWGIGFTLSLMCFFFVKFRTQIGPTVYLPLVKATVLTCNLATWFESSNGFCFGCFVYNSVVVPMYKLEECSECKL